MAELNSLSTLLGDANLLAYYRFEGNSNDYKNTYNGTDTNITYGAGTGKYTQGAAFASASSSKIVCGGQIPIGGTDFTIAFWVNPTDANPASAQNITANHNTTGTAQYILYRDTTKKIGLNGIGKGILETASAIDAATWTHIAFTLSGTTCTVYVNGSANNTGTVNQLATTTNYTYIGCRQYSGFEQYFNGKLDDMCFFSRALSSTEVGYLNGAGPSGLANLKTWNGLAQASVKTLNGLAIASVKSWNGLT